MNTEGCCQIGKMIFGTIIFSVALQIFFCLIAVAVAAGNGYVPIVAFSHVLSWPVYFICLALAILSGLTHCMCRCCASGSSCTPSKK